MIFLVLIFFQLILLAQSQTNDGVLNDIIGHFSDAANFAQSIITQEVIFKDDNDRTTTISSNQLFIYFFFFSIELHVNSSFPIYLP